MADFIDFLVEKSQAINKGRKTVVAKGKNVVTDVTNEPIALEQYNLELHEADCEFENGDYISNDEMIQQIKKW